jgi:hemoglobin/transferrin/lactoferrin receptor protein
MTSNPCISNHPYSNQPVMQKTITLLLLLCLTLFQSGFTQIIKVIDKSDLQPIENAVVFNANKSHSATSDKYGNIDLSSFAPEESIVFSHITYQPYLTKKLVIINNGGNVMMTENIIQLNQVVVSANKIQENKSDIPQKVDVISSRQISFNNPQNAGDLLQQTGNVFTQQSQQGASSPVLRGFEANKVLLVVDGVRMNNAIYRTGHLQNVITLDPNILDRVEILYGPGSVIYGSDAIGGVVSFFTKSPLFSTTDKTFVKAGGSIKYASAGNESSGNVNINIGLKKWAFLSNISFKNIGDLREGNIYNSKYGDWGKCLYYSGRINGKDSMLVNQHPNLQIHSGYQQYDILQKALFKPTNFSQYTLNLQLSNSGNIPRYDRLAEMNGSQLKYADWYYGPQTRLLTSLKAEYTKKYFLYDNATIIAAYQYISEDRITRKFNNVQENHQEETVNVFSLNVDFRKQLGTKHELRYGVETTYNHVGSVAYNLNIDNNIKLFNTNTRYPDNGSQMVTTAAYATHNWEINKKLIFSQGLRLSVITLNASFSDTMMSILKFPFNKNITQNSEALNGNLGLVYMPNKGWRFSLMASSGFRAPNVDDLTQLNTSKPDNVIVIPNPGIQPEYAYNLDLTIGKTINDIVHLEVTGFYTLLKDAIVVSPFKLNGQDTIVYEGTKLGVQAASNAGEAFVYGIQANAQIQFNQYISVSSGITYTHGRIKGTDTPIDHIPPLYGMTSVKFETIKFKAEFYARYNGWKHLSDYSINGEDNLSQATADGTPSWFTLNIRGGYQLNKKINLQLGMENILDIHYRNFASGISAPGRNLILVFRINI